MPIKIPGGLPAAQTLESEHIFVMDESRAQTQDIRPLRIAILNLMPTKIVTETQLIRLLSNTPLQIELTLLGTETYRATHISEEHMESFYQSFSAVKDKKFDGLIITGAPVENLEFSDVAYWDELCAILDWSRTHVYSTLHICWAAQAGLYHHYGIQKYALPKKMFGIFEHEVILPRHPLLRGFDETFLAPHSRHTTVYEQDIEDCPQLDILARSDRAGVYIVADRNARQFYITGHAEYDYDTLSREYFRDTLRGLDIDIPYNYFPGNDTSKTPRNVWRGHAHLLFSNWLNYFVYQRTPYDIDSIE
ncbi:MAG: homoserine O-succinyltransferase [Ruminococcaceae bacterium]|nr:homoserine O-succinyltransferase [Oscillospiraceae bacterium]